jgi:hypothetical protein
MLAGKHTDLTEKIIGAFFSANSLFIYDIAPAIQRLKTADCHPPRA